MPLNNISNALSMNIILDKIFMRLGASSRKIILEELDIAKIIAYETIPTYSKFFPWEYIHRIKIEDQINNLSGYYRVESPTPIISINRMIGGIDTRAGLGNINRPYVDGSVNMSYSDADNSLINEGVINNFNAVTTLPVTIRFDPPNICQIFPKGDYIGQSLLCNCMHPVTLHTIPWNMVDEFFSLAYSDVALAIKNILKKFENIPTIYGELNLNLEELEKAIDAKEGKLELFRSKSLLRQNNKRWYIS